MKKVFILLIIFHLSIVSSILAECQIGAFVNPGSRNINVDLSVVDEFESLTGRNLAIINFFIGWNDFPAADCDRCYQNGSVPMVTWELHTGKGTNTLQDIIDGGQDEYIEKFALAVKGFGKDIFIRFGHEMNGNWYDWDGFHNGANNTNYGNPALYDGPERYVKVFQYVHNKFQAMSVNNAKWVWCVNADSVPDAEWNKASNYYPGDVYVDWLSIDGYNWGGGSGYPDWESFDEIYGSIYNELISLSSKPIIIAEFSCSEKEISGSSTNYVDNKKAEWITDTFSKIKNNYTRIKAFCWFQINKERDWQVNSGFLSLDAYRQAISDKYFWEFGSTEVYSEKISPSYTDNLDINIGPNYFKTGESIKCNIFYRLKRQSYISIKIYDSNARFIRTIIDNEAKEGNEVIYNDYWNGKDDKGKDVSSGLYFMDIKEGETFHKVEKILLVR